MAAPARILALAVTRHEERISALPGRVPAEDFPDAPPQKIVPGSLVFTPPAGEVSFEDPLGWWRYVLPSVRTHRVIPSLRGVEWPLRP